jgi:RNA polymerase sigma-70 factor (ECF subfamily)
MGCHHQNEDDVAQEVCLALLAALPGYTDTGKPFGAYVFGIAAHKVADVARGAARASTPIPMPDVPDRPDGHPGPEEAVLRGIEASRARRLLARLPVDQRRLLLLRVVTGLSAEETGYVLDMTPGAVRVAQHRALARLRQLAAKDEAAAIGQAALALARVPAASSTSAARQRGLGRRQILYRLRNLSSRH